MSKQGKPRLVSVTDFKEVSRRNMEGGHAESKNTESKAIPSSAAEPLPIIVHDPDENEVSPSFFRKTAGTFARLGSQSLSLSKSAASKTLGKTWSGCRFAAQKTWGVTWGGLKKIPSYCTLRWNSEEDWNDKEKSGEPAETIQTNNKRVDETKQKNVSPPVSPPAQVLSAGEQYDEDELASPRWWGIGIKCLSAAAVIAILVGGYFAILPFTKKETSPSHLADADSEPVSESATASLSAESEEYADSNFRSGQLEQLSEISAPSSPESPFAQQPFAQQPTASPASPDTLPDVLPEAANNSPNNPFGNNASFTPEIPTEAANNNPTVDNTLVANNSFDTISSDMTTAADMTSGTDESGKAVKPVLAEALPLPLLSETSVPQALPALPMLVAVSTDIPSTNDVVAAGNPAVDSLPSLQSSSVPDSLLLSSSAPSSSMPISSIPIADVPVAEKSSIRESVASHYTPPTPITDAASSSVASSLPQQEVGMLFSKAPSPPPAGNPLSLPQKAVVNSIPIPQSVEEIIPLIPHVGTIQDVPPVVVSEPVSAEPQSPATVYSNESVLSIPKKEIASALPPAFTAPERRLARTVAPSLNESAPAIPKDESPSSTISNVITAQPLPENSPKNGPQIDHQLWAHIRELEESKEMASQKTAPESLRSETLRFDSPRINLTNDSTAEPALRFTPRRAHSAPESNGNLLASGMDAFSGLQFDELEQESKDIAAMLPALDNAPKPAFSEVRPAYRGDNHNVPSQERSMTFKNRQSEMRQSAVRYVVQEGDSVFRLATDKLKDSTRWREILAINEDQLQDPRDLRPGMEILLPMETAQSYRQMQR